MELKKNMVARTGRELQRYNFLGHRQVVGCIPYRVKANHGTPLVDVDKIEDGIEVLVITSQRKGKGWEKDETIEDAALRETLEEAGVVGDVETKLGKWNFMSKNNDTCYEGHMFLMLVKEELEFWPEKDARQRLWVSVSEARKVCQYWWMKEALELFVNRLIMAARCNHVDKAEDDGLLRKSNL